VATGPRSIAPRLTTAVKQRSNLRTHIPPRLDKSDLAIQGKLSQIRPPAEPERKPETDIGEAISLANQGRLIEAEKLCQKHISKHGASAQTLYLIGLILDARGDISEASQYYRKTLYLDHDHQEALGHLALLLRKQGDLEGARILRDRMSRIQQKRAK
jgi:chemotaxis protein methyltransferase WspC